MALARNRTGSTGMPTVPVGSYRAWVFRKILRQHRHLVPLIARFPRLWHWVNTTPRVRRIFNRLLVNLYAYAAQPRPNALTLFGPELTPEQAAAPEEIGPMADYVTWPGLIDRRYTVRQLPPADPAWMARLPHRDDLKKIFRRPAGETTYCHKSSALLGFWAQWFTDGFMRVDPADPRKNNSNHDIELCQVYGLNDSDTDILRAKTGGRLKSQRINGQEYPPYLFENGDVKPEFRGLSYLTLTEKGTWDYREARLANHPLLTPERRAYQFATGVEAGNVTLLFSGLTTIFLREHNRLCAELHAAHPDWDDEHLFHTARIINIVVLLRIVVEDFVNHLSPTHFRLVVDNSWAEREYWYRTSRINAEFNLLYRWHGLMPDSIEVPGSPIAATEYMHNNEELIKHGVEAIFDAASRQPAGLIGLFNTPEFLMEAEMKGMDKSRGWGIRSYNDYRELYSLGRMKTFEDISSDPRIVAALKGLYGSVDDVEFLVGLLAEDRFGIGPLGATMSIMVGTDAFTQVFNNPLLSRYVYGAEAFSEVGMDTIENTWTLAQLVERNSNQDRATPLVSFNLSPAAVNQAAPKPRRFLAALTARFAQA